MSDASGAIADMRLAFMGTPDFALPTYRALVAEGARFACVYTRPPAPAGRGMRTRPSPVHEAAEADGFPVHAPSTLRTKDEHARFAALHLDAAIVVAYGQILPPAILDAPRLGCLNLHPSLLPRWRGAAPVERAIEAGDAQTGVSIMRLDAGLDTGPLLLTSQCAIGADMDAGALREALAQEGAAAMCAALAAYAKGEISPTPQEDKGVCYAEKFSAEETRIVWTQTADEITRRIRALAPVPGAWCALSPDDKAPRLRILRAEKHAGAGKPGHILSQAPLTIACGRGALRPLRLQRAGRAAMDVDAFMRGARLETGVFF